MLDMQQAKCLQSIRGEKGGTLFAELTELLRREVPVRVHELTQHAAAQNGPLLAQRAHALAGSCASLGGRQMQAAARALESAADAADWAAVPVRLAVLKESWVRLNLALIAFEEGAIT
ncbi:MAG: Hpt domain-containing protein [Opitutae bacterium]|nr:Hpt domain-containing protein [Opitutae bacterium]